MSRHRAAARDYPAAAGWGTLLVLSLGFIALTLAQFITRADTLQERAVTVTLFIFWTGFATGFTRAAARALTKH